MKMKMSSIIGLDEVSRKFDNLISHFSKVFGEERVRNALKDFNGGKEFKSIVPNPVQSLGEGLDLSSKSVVIVKNYGPKSHAIFGDTKDIKNELTALIKNGKKVVGYNNRLAFGPGWTVMDKNNLEVVVGLLKKLKMNYREVEREDYEKEVGKDEEEKSFPKVVAKSFPKIAKSSVPDEEDEGDNEPIAKSIPKVVAKSFPKIVAKSSVSDEEDEGDNEPIPKSIPKAAVKSFPKIVAKSKPVSKVPKIPPKISKKTEDDEGDDEDSFLEN